MTLLLGPSSAIAGAELPFSFTSPGGAIADDRITFFDLEMTPPIPEITYIEMDLIGLTHSSPMDLDIYLINPFGRVIEIITDRGDQHDISNNITLTFANNGQPLPDPNDPLTAGRYQPEGFSEEADDGFDTYVGHPGVGSSPWILVVSDDDPSGTGAFTAWTLRGTYVPEPISASLLAIGALVALRRPRRS